VKALRCEDCPARGFEKSGQLTSRSKDTVRVGLHGPAVAGIVKIRAYPHTSIRAGIFRKMGSPKGSVVYVSHRQEKFHFPDGRRGVRFYLIDEGGKATPAVLGEERETCDGHYVYKKEPVFSAGEVVTCGNLAGVHRWLRELMSGQPNVPGTELRSQAASEPNRSGEPETPVKRASSKAGGENQGYGKAKETTSTVSKALTAHQAIAERKALKKAEHRNSALAYVREVPLEDVKNDILGCAQTLENCLKMQKEDGACSASAFNETLEALRRLQTLYINLPLLESTKIGEIVDALSRGPDEMLARIAKTLVRQWLGALLVSVKVLSEEPEPLPASLINMYRVAAGANEKQASARQDKEDDVGGAVSGKGLDRSASMGYDSKPALGSNLGKRQRNLRNAILDRRGSGFRGNWG